MNQRISRFAFVSLAFGLAAIALVSAAWSQWSLELAYVGLWAAGFAVPLGLVAVGRRVAGVRRGLRFAVPGIVLGTAILAPLGYALTSRWTFG